MHFVSGYANSQNNFIIPISDLGSCRWADVSLGLQQTLSGSTKPMTKHAMMARPFLLSYCHGILPLLDPQRVGISEPFNCGAKNI